jgi:streptogramin lyase
MTKKAFFFLAIAIIVPSFLQAQQTRTVTANQLRLDLRHLGHPPIDVIPPDESAVTSLVVGSDGILYGATSGKRAHLFALDPAWGHVFPLGHLPGEESIYHSLASAPDSSIYIGTTLNNIGRIDERGQDALARYEDYPGGHVYRFNPVEERDSRRRMQHPVPSRALPNSEDLGIPVLGEGIVSLLTGDGELYGVTFPTGHFFVIELATGQIEDKGPVCGSPLHEEPFRSIPRALAMDGKGRVWGAGDYGALFHYEPEAGEIHHHPEHRLPSELGREFKTILDALVLGPDSLLYGGTSDGFLFRFDPETMEMANLGKPMWQYRIRGLAFSKDGDLWGVGGERGGAARLFVYRTELGGFENLGLLDVNRSPYYAWLAFEAESMIAGPDGTIFIGESGRISHLYLLYPWK